MPGRLARGLIRQGAIVDNLRRSVEKCSILSILFHKNVVIVY